MNIRDLSKKMGNQIQNLVPLFRYLVLQTETHAFCGSLAFFAMLGFYPFSFLLLSFTKFGIQWDLAYKSVVETLRTYYPVGQDFFLHNLQLSVLQHGEKLQISAVVWIMLGAAGVFIPLEMAFNRLWKLPESRPYWKNQLLGFSLTALCCVLAVAFVIITTVLQSTINWLLPFRLLQKALNYIVFKAAFGIFLMAVIFLFYKFLPNGKIDSMQVLPAAILVGIVAEVVRHIYLFVLPWMNLEKSQGPYHISTSFLLLAYFETFVLLGGAFLATESKRYSWMGWSWLRLKSERQTTES